MAANANKPKSLTLRAEPDPANCYGTQNAARIAEALSAGRAVMLPAGASFADYAGMPRRQSETAPDLELTPPPDKKAERRCRQIEFAEQSAYFAQVNRRLDPAELAHGRFVALPDWPGADMIYAVPNANVAGRNVGAKLIQGGLRRGYPDINIDVPRAPYHGLRIEMKRPAGVPSDTAEHQVHWHERLRDHGYRVAVCFGYREAWAVTAHYLGWDDAS